MEDQMNKKRIFAIGILIFIVIATIISFSVGDEKKNQEPEIIVTSIKTLDSDPVKTYFKGPIHFNPSKAKPYWVARWNSPGFFSYDDSYDGCAYDAEFIIGTRIDSLVYYIERCSNIEKYFYAKDLSLDPRAAAWWQQSVMDINDNKFVNNFYTAVRECLGIREDFVDGHQTTLYFINEIKRLSLLEEKENPTLSDIRMALLRYTYLYYGENIGKEKAESILKKWDKV